MDQNHLIFINVFDALLLTPQVVVVIVIISSSLASWGSVYNLK